MALFLLQAVIDNTGLVIAAAVLMACFVVFYFAMQRAISRNSEQLRREFEERLSLVMIKARLAEPIPRGQVAAPPIPVPSPVMPPVAAPVASAVHATEEITPEVMLVIAAAVTAFLGKAVRIRSARMLYSHESFNAWSQQGRAVIQASHNLAQRGY